jgi:bacterioferritin
MKIRARFVNSSAPNFASRTLQQGGLNVSATSKAPSAAAQHAPLRLAAMLLDYLNAANARYSECRSYYPSGRQSNFRQIEPREKIKMSEFVTDLKKIRERARQHMEQGAVTQNYGADRKAVLKVLNEVLATELVCVLRYKRHYYTASGINAEGAKDQFLEHANDEQQHVDWVADRITQLGGEPDFNPKDLATRSHSEYVEGNDLASMIKEDLVAERIAIDSYSEIVRWLGDGDPTTRKMIEEILKTEEDHAEDMKSLLTKMS